MPRFWATPYIFMVGIEDAISTDMFCKKALRKAWSRVQEAHLLDQ